MSQEPFRIQEKTLGALLDETTAKHPDNTAVVYANEEIRLTWKQLSAEVDALAKGLVALGVKNGDKVAVWATNAPYWISLMFATAKIGAILIPVNTSYRESELHFLLKHSDCSVMFTSKPYRDHVFIDTLYKVVPDICTSQKGEIQKSELPFLRKVVFMGDAEHEGLYTMPEVLDLGNSISDALYEELKAAVDPYDVVNMQYTSGTTGTPKGVMLTHVNILNNGYWIGAHQHFTAKDIACLPVPLFHCFGCVLGVMAFVNHGVTMVLMEYFDPLQALTLIEREQCTAIYGVPTMFLAMLEHRSFSKYSMKSLRTGIMAGSVCPEPLMRRVVDQMNMAEITICYGLTETSPVMSQTKADESIAIRVSTVGKAMPGVEVRVVDPDTMEEQPRGTPGEVVCRGYNIMKGYYGLPEETAKVLTPEGWLHSGDLGTMDEDGYLVITGRTKDMIIRGGENIYPIEIEEFISEMPEVFDIQVVGVPSRRYGEEVAAFIIPKKDAILTKEKIRSFCKGRIAWQKVPRHIIFIDEFPLTASGKVQKFKLRSDAEAAFHHLDSK